MRFRLASLMALAATTPLAYAANVVNITGPSPFGFTTTLAKLAAWTQGAVYTNVTIRMPLEDNSSGGPIAGVEGTVYLMNQIGPGTTTANQVAPPIVISGLSDAFTPRTLFTGLTLPAGNYYVVLVPANAQPASLSPAGFSNPVVTTGPSVISLGGAGTLSLAAYPPASSFGFEGTLAITVTSDPIAPPPTPAPSSLILTLTAMGGLGIYQGRKFLQS
jgi:hypothetical protein